MKRYFQACCIVVAVVLFPVACLGPKRTGVDAAKLMEQGKTAEAFQVLEGLAAEGDDKAMLQLGIYYHQGTVVKQDYAKAMDWFLRAVSQQNADAFVNLGVMHRDGQAVPPNKKIAFCVFLTTHMHGLGSSSTQQRSNSCLRRLLEELSKDDIKDCLSNYTLGYIKAYLEARGEMTGIPEPYRPSSENPALKDLGWFLDSEIDALYGEPTEEEKRAREERDRKRRIAYETLQHTLVFQIRFPKDTERQYGKYEVITDHGMSSGPLREITRPQYDGYVVSENQSLIWANRHRYVSLETKANEAFVYKIEHPVEPVPCDWSHWQKVAFVLGNRMDSFALLHGSEPKSKTTDLPADAPELRFKVVKE